MCNLSFEPSDCMTMIQPLHVYVSIYMFYNKVQHVQDPEATQGTGLH